MIELETVVAGPVRARIGRMAVPSARWRLILSLGVALSGPLSVSAVAQTEPALSLDQAQALALQHTQAIGGLLEAARAAEERALGAQRRPDPVLRLSLDNVPVEGGSDRLFSREPTTARSIGLSQAWPHAAKRAAQSAVFTREADQARVEARAEARRLWQATGLAWLGLRAEQQRLLSLDAQRRQADRLRGVTEAAYGAGRATLADVLGVRQAQAKLDDERLRLQLEVAQARTTLQRWTGLDNIDTLAPAPDWGVPVWTDESAATLVQADPELQLSAAQELVAAAAVQAARQDRDADWSVDLRYQQRGARFDNMVTLGLSIPLRWGPDTRQQRELLARLAQQRMAQARHEEARRTSLAQVQVWQQRWRSGLARLQWHDEQLARLADARAETALAAYRSGAGPLSALLQAQQAVLALQLDRIQLELATASDWLRLHTLARPVGLPLSVAPEQQP